MRVRLRASSLSFYSSRFRVCFHFLYCSTFSAIGVTSSSYRHLSPQPCRARLPSMFLIPQLHFFSFFPPSFLFSVYVFPCSAWRWHHIPAPLYLRASRRQFPFLSFALPSPSRSSNPVG